MRSWISCQILDITSDMQLLCRDGNCFTGSFFVSWSFFQSRPTDLTTDGDTIVIVAGVAAGVAACV